MVTDVPEHRNADTISIRDARWLRWQLTMRGGHLWHETCQTCQNWERIESDPEFGGCLEVMSPRDMTHSDQACSLYHEKIHEEERM